MEIQNRNEHRKNQIKIALNFKNVEYKEYRQAIKVDKDDTYIAIYESGNVELLNDKIRLKRRVSDIVKYIEENL